MKATCIIALLLLTSCVSEEKKVTNNLEESLKDLKDAQKQLDEAFQSMDSLDVKVQMDTVQ